METKELEAKIARLEFENDQLNAELAYMDQLLKEVGFSEGLKSVKVVALEMVEETLDQED